MSDISSLLDRGELLDIFRNFSQLTGLGVSLCDLDGNEAVSYYKDGGSCICRILDGGSACRESLRYSAKKAAELGEPYIYVCGCGLVMSASAVTLGDELIGAVLCGPAMLWDADDYALDELAEKTRLTPLTDNNRERIAENTPKLSCAEISGASSILFRLVNYMCKSRSEYLSQRQEISKQQATISVLLAESKTAPERQGRYSPEMERKLLTAVRLGDRAGARKVLNGILADIFLYSGGKPSAITAKVYELSGFLFRAASESGAAEEELLKVAGQMQRLLLPDMSFEELCYTAAATMESFIDAVYNSRAGIPGARYLSEAVAYMNENYGKYITLKETSGHVGVSASYLAHLFSGGLNTTFTEYLTGIRTDAAKELLANTDMKISLLAEKVGYDDPNYFIRAFKKRVGVSPKQYRKLRKR